MSGRSSGNISDWLTWDTERHPPERERCSHAPAGGGDSRHRGAPPRRVGRRTFTNRRSAIMPPVLLSSGSQVVVNCSTAVNRRYTSGDTDAGRTRAQQENLTTSKVTTS